MLRREELLHLVVALRDLLFQGRPSRLPPGLLVRRELMCLHQLRLLGLLQVLHLHGERGELGYRLSPLFHIPVSDVLFLESPGVPPDIVAARDLVAALHVLHGEQHVVLAAHVVEAEVRRGGVGRGRQHRLRHDAWDV